MGQMRLKSILDASVSANAATRLASEQHLSQLSGDAVFLECLELALGPDGLTSRIAVVYIKNLIKSGKIDDMQLVKQGLIQALLKSHDAAMTLSLCVCISEFARINNIEWGRDIEEMLVINNNESAMVVCGVLVLHAVAKHHPEIAVGYMPKLLVLARQSLQDGSAMAATMLWKILKVYKLAIDRPVIEDYFCQELEPWMDVFVQLVQANDTKCCKWAMRIINMLYIEHAVAADGMTRVAVNSQFASKFNNTLAPVICRVYQEQVRLVKQWTVHNQCCLLRFFNECADRNVGLDTETVFKLVCATMVMTDNELDLFENDVVEFYNEQYPDQDDEWSPQALAEKLVVKLGGGGDDDDVWGYIEHLLINGGVFEKDCALRILICNPGIYRQFNLLKLFDGQVLTARALEAVAQFGDETLYEEVVPYMKSDCLMLRVRSVEAIRALLVYDSVRAKHRPLAQATVEIVFQTLELFDDFLEDLFSFFGDELAPHAVSLFARLRVLYFETKSRAVIDAMTSIIYSLDQISLIERAMETALPVIQHALPESAEVVEACIISTNHIIIPAAWKVFDYIVHVYDPDMLPLLSQFVSCGADQISQSARLRDGLFSILQLEFKRSPVSVYACAVFVVALVCCKPHVLNSHIAALPFPNSSPSSSSSSSSYIDDTIFALIYYNPETLPPVEIDQLITKWVNPGQRPCSKKLRIVALLRILTTPHADTIAPYLTQLATIFKQEQGFVEFDIEDSDLTDMQQALDQVDEHELYTQTMQYLAANNYKLLAQIQSL